MKAKQFLNQYSLAETRIKEKRADRQALMWAATSITSGARPDGGTPSGVSDKVGNIATKMAQLSREIDEQIDAQLRIQREITDVLDQLEDRNQYKVLERHYIKLEAFEDIAYDMAYSCSRIYQIHSAAVREVQAIIDYKKL